MKRVIRIPGLVKPSVKSSVKSEVDILPYGPTLDNVENNRRTWRALSRNLNSISRYTIGHGQNSYPISWSSYNGVILPEPRFSAVCLNTGLAFIDGCLSLHYQCNPEVEIDNCNVVWAYTFRRPGQRALTDVFSRTREYRLFCDKIFSIPDVITCSTRPLDKIRFPGYEFFIPEPNFVYVGYPYY